LHPVPGLCPPTLFWSGQEASSGDAAGRNIRRMLLKRSRLS
jgi:hypothetical protein